KDVIIPALASLPDPKKPLPLGTMPGWHDYPHLFEAECIQCLEEGREPGAVQAIQDEAARLAPEAPASTWEELLARVMAVPIRPDFPFQEPDDLEEIRELAGRRKESRPVKD